MRHDTRFVLVCAILFLIGGGLRLTAGGSIPPSTATALELPSATPARGPEPVPPEVSATVLDFYNAVDKGRYAEAYALALENHWSQAADGAAQVDGLATEDKFVSLLTDELGANGMSLNIIAIEPLDQALFTPAETDAEKYPELRILDFLPSGAGVTHLYQVHMGGTLLGRCSRWDWSKHVLVAQLDDAGWRVLLPGMKGPYKPHYEEWFLDRTL